MIACTAYMAGYDLQSDQIQTYIYSCLAGLSINKFLTEAVIDSYNRLLFPQIETEIRANLKEKADTQSIEVFGKNLKPYFSFYLWK